MNEFELDRALRDLAPALAWPDTPDLAAAVERRLAAPARRRRAWRPLLVAAVLLAVLTAVAAAAAVRIWGDVPGVLIQRVAQLPAVPVGGGLGLGDRVALDGLAADAPDLTLPTVHDSLLGPPDAAFVDRVEGSGASRVTLAWRPRPGLPALARFDVGALLTVERGSVDPIGIEKMVGPDTTVERVRVDGEPGYWLEGEPHVVIFDDATGSLTGQDVRLAGNVLLWQHDGLVLRLEADVPKAVALRIASSVQ